MELVIKIPDDKYHAILNHAEEVLDESSFIEPKYLYLAVINGTPLPKGHGRLKDIDKFPVNEIERMEYNYECGENECHSEEIVYLDDIINAETIIKAESEDNP